MYIHWLCLSLIVCDWCEDVTFQIKDRLEERFVGKIENYLFADNIELNFRQNIDNNV